MESFISQYICKDFWSQCHDFLPHILQLCIVSYFSMVVIWWWTGKPTIVGLLTRYIWWLPRIFLIFFSSLCRLMCTPLNRLILLAWIVLWALSNFQEPDLPTILNTILSFIPWSVWAFVSIILVVLIPLAPIIAFPMLMLSKWMPKSRKIILKDQQKKFKTPIARLAVPVNQEDFGDEKELIEKLPLHLQVLIQNPHQK